MDIVGLFSYTYRHVIANKLPNCIPRLNINSYIYIYIHILKMFQHDIYTLYFNSMNTQK